LTILWPFAWQIGKLLKIGSWTMEHWAYAKKHAKASKEYRHAPNHEPLPLNKKTKTK